MAETDAREFLQTTPGRVATAGVIVALAGGLIWYAKSALGPSEAAQMASRQTFVDAKTGKAFTVDLKPGMKIPTRAPSGEDSGYPAELCYWTADGQVKSDPDPVLMNTYVGKPEPTFCPVCRRLVVHHNPKPRDGQRPPPTEQEYGQRGGGAGR